MHVYRKKCIAPDGFLGKAYFGCHVGGTSGTKGSVQVRSWIAIDFLQKAQVEPRLRPPNYDEIEVLEHAVVLAEAPGGFHKPGVLCVYVTDVGAIGVSLSAHLSVWGAPFPRTKVLCLLAWSCCFHSKSTPSYTASTIFDRSQTSRRRM